MKTLAISALIPFVVACSARPVEIAPRPATTIAASSGKTWDAVVAVFATLHAPIRTIDKASGIITTSPMTVERTSPVNAWADCGKSVGMQTAPAFADYTVLVRGDSTSATIRTSLNFVGRRGEPCVSSGRFEDSFDAAVRAHLAGLR